MCGRFSFITSKKQIQNELGEDLAMDPVLAGSYNVAPTQPGYVITNRVPRHLQAYTWGLVPHWVNDGSNNGSLINARVEGIASKPSFRMPVRDQRCLVLADSFYEWTKMGSQRIPYRILNKNRKLLVMAGVWDTWEGAGRTIHSFSILTTPPNHEMARLHTRMPLLLPTLEHQEAWLSQLDITQLQSLMQTPADGLLEYYRVSDKVNSVYNDEPALHQRLPDLLTLF